MRKAVLIVEDEEILLRNLSNALRRTGLDVIGASSIGEARRSLTAQKFALICVDVQLGDGNGLELISEVRADDPGIPLVVMTGQDSIANRMRAEEVEVSAFLAKPFALSRFRELIRTLLLEDAGASAAVRGPSVLMYSHDTIGLGHMRRNSNIASHLVGMMPEASVLMLVGSPAGAVFDLPPGVDFIKLPSLAKVAHNVWRPSSLRITPDNAREIRTGLIERAAETFRPDILLVDHEPAGVWDELVPSLKALRALPTPPHVVLGIRDILDDPERTRAQWQNRGIDRLLGDYYDEVLIYGDRDIYPAHAHYGLDRIFGNRASYCGYVTNNPSAQPITSARDPAMPRILVSGGGGRDACPMMEAVISGLVQMPEPVRAGAILIAGPLMEPELREPLKQQAHAAGLGFLDSTPDLPEMLAVADLFVTMGGYNALTEAAAAGCPTLVIPRVGPSAEQRLRAELFADLGLVETLELHAATPERLAERFAEVRPGTPRRSCGLPVDGGLTAAGRLAELLSEKHPETTFLERRGIAHG